jgi:hypothetical protein
MLVFSYNLSASSSHSTSKVCKKQQSDCGHWKWTYGEHWRVIESFRAIEGQGEQKKEVERVIDIMERRAVRKDQWREI